jgi:hypothetical protein
MTGFGKTTTYEQQAAGRPDVLAAPRFGVTDLLIPLTDVAALKAAGIHYPATEDAWRWCYRHRHARGLAGAFKLNGRRIVVDVDAFKAAVRGSEVVMQAQLER